MIGTRVFDRLAVSERHLLAAEASPMGAGFDPARAAVYLGTGDPPRTAVFRGAMEGLRAYTEALAGLASDTAPDAIAAATDVGHLALGLPVGGGAAFGDLAGHVQRVLPALASVGERRDAASMKRALVTAHPQFRQLLLTVRASTPAIYLVLRQAQVVPGNLTDPDGIPPAGRVVLDRDRRTLAAWVVLLDQTLIAMDRAAASLDGGDGSALALSDASLRLRALAAAFADVHLK